jgi:hypothetical protein
MNEEVNFCSQCGETVRPGVKCCSSCGHDLKNSSTKITSDKTVKVEVTNVTVEKGFESVGKGIAAIRAITKLSTEIVKRVFIFLLPFFIVAAVL